MPSALSLLGKVTDQLGTAYFPVALFELLNFSSGYDYVFLAVFYDETPPVPLYSNLSEHEAEVSITPYIDGTYYRDDPWYDLVRRRADDGVFRLADHVSEDFVQSPYYLQYYQNTLLTDEAAIFVRLNDNACLVISLGLRRADAPDRGQLELLRMLLPCIQSLCRKQWTSLYGEPRDAEAAGGAVKALSRRESQILDMVLEGLSNKEIARRIEISPETVKVYRRRMLRKLDASSSRELFRRALEDAKQAGGEARVGELLI